MNLFSSKEIVINFFKKKYNLYEISKYIDINIIHDIR